MIDQKPVTLIVSDLHMGDGKYGDDFVDDTHQFARFINSQSTTTEGQLGQIELIVNGDFFEFVQVCPQAYKLNSLEFWCSEDESLEKLDHILNGHREALTALRGFQLLGNRVTIFAGNHDVDLYWPTVQSRIAAVAGDVNFELRKVWFDRYGGKVRISHGHLFPSIDPVNGYKNWSEPRLKQTSDHLPLRLEMCAGTLFVVKYVNLLEQEYPFADNLHPQIALAEILLREDRWGLVAIGWLLAKFVARYWPQALGLDQLDRCDFASQLVKAVQSVPAVRTQVSQLYRDLFNQPHLTDDQITKVLISPLATEEFIEKIFLSDIDRESWLRVLDAIKPQVIGEGGSTLSISRAGRIDVKNSCIEIARNAWRDGAEIVVLGHTHLPQEYTDSGKSYFNPGSWTRYIESTSLEKLRLQDLKREDTFPYELNYVRIEDDGTNSLKRAMICFERQSS